MILDSILISVPHDPEFSLPQDSAVSSSFRSVTLHFRLLSVPDDFGFSSFYSSTSL